MTVEAVVQFLEATAQDEALRKNLADIMGVGDGDISSSDEMDSEEAQALLGQRALKVTALAEQNGYSFSVAELNAVIGVFQRYKAGELSGAEFSRALGQAVGSTQPESQMGNIENTVNLVYRGVKHQVPKSDQDAASSSQVLDFIKRTAEDEEFRKKLQEILQVGDGDISDFSSLDDDEAAALSSERGALVAEFAAKHGYVFTLADLLAVTDAFQRVQANELTPDEFEKFLNLDVKSKDYFPFIEHVVAMTYLGAKYHAPITSKSKGNALPVIRFMERSGTDSELRDKLMAVLGGDGDISKPSEMDSEEAGALSGDNSSKVVKLGAEYGYHFSPADLGTVVGAFQMVSNGQLPVESAARILGLGSSETAMESVQKTARMYRGTSY